MELRRLTDEGVRGFGEFLDSLTTGAPQDYPRELLTDEHASEPCGDAVQVEGRHFGSRLAAAQYIYEQLSGSEIQDPERDAGIWAWLALFYFDELCPRDRDGRLVPKEKARWVPAIGDYKKYYRHLLAGPYLIYKAHRDDPQRAIVLLCGPLHKPGEIVEQILGRQEMIANKAVVELASRLYYDAANGSFKRGAAGKGGGSARRLADFVNQLDLTWDLYAMSADELMQMLPAEFDRFTPQPANS